jgi:MFS family permease
VPPRATYRQVFAVREFRVLWSSVILSTAGDRLALVALTLLVFDRTRSPLLAAAVYAVGYVPWVIGGLFLAELADRYSRRSVMVVCDAARAVLVGVMVLPHLPLGALVALLFAATMFAPPFDSAKASITPDILSGERYVLGTAVLQTTLLTGEVLGAVGGGVAVAFIGVRSSLAVDAATFVVSGLLIGLGLHGQPESARPAAAQPESAPSSPLARMRDGFRLVFGDRALSTLLLFGWLIVFYTLPAGIAAPYVARLGGGPIATGAVIASTALGTMLALPVFTRFVRPRQRINLMGPLAILTCCALIPIGLRPGLAVSLVIFGASAAFGVYQVAANTAFVVRVPAQRRAQAFGIANMGVVVGQGAAYVAAGAAAELVTPAAVIAIAGGLGAVCALALTIRWRHVSPPWGRHASRRPGHAEASESVPLPESR